MHKNKSPSFLHIAMVDGQKYVDTYIHSYT